MTGHDSRKLIKISIFFQPVVSTESINHLPYCFQVKKIFYQSPLILTELFQHNLINVSYLMACYLYEVMMTLHFLNDVANDAESTQKTKITS